MKLLAYVRSVLNRGAPTPKPLTALEHVDAALEALPAELAAEENRLQQAMDAGDMSEQAAVEAYDAYCIHYSAAWGTLNEARKALRAINNL